MLESTEVSESEGVDTRMLVLAEDGEILRNYFVGGYLARRGEEEEIVCRQVTFEGEQAIMTIREDGSLNIPSHLRLPPVQVLDLD